MSRRKESDIVYESNGFWVLRDMRSSAYVVMKPGITHSTSDSAYALDSSGLSIATARCDYLAKRARQ